MLKIVPSFTLTIRAERSAHISHLDSVGPTELPQGKARLGKYARSNNVLEVAVPFPRSVLALLGAWSCGREMVVDGCEECPMGNPAGKGDGCW